MSLLRLLISFSHRPTELAVDVARQASMNDFSQPVEVSLGRQERVVIPAALRRELGFEEGDALVARQELGRLVLEKPEQIKQRRVRDRLAKH